jgi:pantothenate synthetase
METAFILYRVTEDYDAYPFALEHDIQHVNMMARFKQVRYVELPYAEAVKVYNEKLEVLQYVKERANNDIS